MKLQLFKKDITPACRYCINNKAAEEEENILCTKYGKVSEEYSCKSFKYSPTMRVPKKDKPLPKFDKSDFSL